MPVVKNEIPILEYDKTQKAVLEPCHEKLGLALPEKAVFAFLGESIEKYAESLAEKGECKKVAEFISATKIYPVYVISYKGEEICLCQAPVGASAAVQIMDWLIGYGVKKIISAGSCGALVPIPENSFLIPVKALRDEGTSYHYLAPSRFAYADSRAVKVISDTLKEHNLPFVECTTWTTDGFFRETEAMVEYRKSEGCQVVEMECSALISCAEFRKVLFGQLLFTADSLADAENYDERSWGKDSVDYALELCLDAVIKM